MELIENKVNVEDKLKAATVEPEPGVENAVNLDASDTKGFDEPLNEFCSKPGILAILTLEHKTNKNGRNELLLKSKVLFY